ncbi:Cysteine--tRNA ligase [Halotydeus destructor]|nr:Cysteine--tRNA ligase [Halotydeus destructor]
MSSSSPGKKLHLYHTFGKEMRPVRVGPDQVQVQVGKSANCGRQLATVYCCGPTVYDDSHLGHAFTYVRFDLFRRVLSVFGNLDLIVAMNITDIDDKILQKARSESTESANKYLTVSQHYYNSFVSDLTSLNVSQPHFFLRVTDHIQDIVTYIQSLEKKGYAYLNNDTKDVVFDSATITPFSQVAELDSDKAKGKKSPRDFVLWKHAKPGEPCWPYLSTSGQTVNGRPGWHVECSAMATGVFGSQIDFHYGGKDLIFPHHYNESACCSAYNGSRDPVHSWSRQWLHSGHLLFNKEKMSKSLGNVVSIKAFLEKYSANILRLFCIRTHYRSDFHYDEALLGQAQVYDSELKQLVHLIQSELERQASGRLEAMFDGESCTMDTIDETEQAMMQGIADDLHLDAGLQAVLKLRHYFEELIGQRKCCLLQLVRAKHLLEAWFLAMGLNYELSPSLSGKEGQSSKETAIALNIIREVRNDIRTLALERRAIEKANSTKRELDEESKVAHQLFNIADKLRGKLEHHGLLVKDSKSESVK